MDKQKLKELNHQNSFITNAKRTSLFGKHKRKKRTQKQAKTIKKMIIETYIQITILNVNGLNAQQKDIDWLH